MFVLGTRWGDRGQMRRREDCEQVLRRCGAIVAPPLKHETPSSRLVRLMLQRRSAGRQRDRRSFRTFDAKRLFYRCDPWGEERGVCQVVNVSGGCHMQIVVGQRLCAVQERFQRLAMNVFKGLGVPGSQTNVEHGPASRQWRFKQFKSVQCCDPYALRCFKMFARLGALPQHRQRQCSVVESCCSPRITVSKHGRGVPSFQPICRRCIATPVRPRRKPVPGATLPVAGLEVARGVRHVRFASHQQFQT